MNEKQLFEVPIKDIVGLLERTQRESRGSEKLSRWGGWGGGGGEGGLRRSAS